MKTVWNHMLDLLYPRRCPGCDGLLKRDEPVLCRTCSGTLKMRTGNVCLCCARPLYSRYESRCAQCLRMSHEFEEALAPFSYSGAMQESLMRFKYHGRAEYASFYARCIWEYGKNRIEQWAPDILLPVPLHKSRLAQRGYNQAALIAKELSAFSGIPVDETMVCRRQKTVAQKELTRAQRRANMEGAFAYSSRGTLPERILLVDDILTTGSTADAISSLLLQHGAKHVYVACVAVP